ncbi:MAG: class I SAM-dependent methyltransferase [Thiogranum sp.]|nr:class I SAM-dependent methyltransferase [Thiogranum sp.]
MSHDNASSCPVCAGPGKYDFSGNDLMFEGQRMFDYHRCQSCGLVYQHPMPANDEIAEFYPDSYSIYSEPAQPWFPPRALRTLKDKLGYSHLKVKGSALEMLLPGKAVPEVAPFIPAGKALDIGCGNGEFLLRLQSIGWTCQGVEFNDKAVGICRSHGLQVFHGDLKSAGFEAGTFDFVTANHLIEHVPDPHELMREIARITKPGGRVLIRTPNSESLGRSWFGTYWFANDIPRHLILYAKRNLQMLAARHGLEPELITTPVKPKIVLKSLDYKLGNRGTPSKKRKLRKWLARLYIPAAKVTGRGDELFVMLVKR